MVGREGSVASCISSGKTLSCRRLCTLLIALLNILLSSVVTTVIGTCHLGLYPFQGVFDVLIPFDLAQRKSRYYASTRIGDYTCIMVET